MSDAVTRKRPVEIHRRGGTAFADPCRSLEHDDRRTLDWQDREDERATVALHADPLYQPAVTALAAGGVPLRPAPVAAGGRWFRVAQDAPTDLPTLRVADHLGRDERVILEPGSVDDGPVILQALPSPDARVVAIVIAPAPSGHPVLRFVAVDEPRVLPDRIELHAGPLAPSWLAWQADSSGVYYVAGDHAASRWGPRSLFFHEIGVPGPDRAEPVPIGHDLSAEPQTSPDGRFVAVLLETVGVPRAAWILDRDDGRGWRPFVTTPTGRCRGVFVGDRYVAVTTVDAPRGRLVAIPTDAGDDPGAWNELVPEGDHVLWSVTDTGSGLLLAAIDDATMRLSLTRYDGAAIGDVAVPGPGAVGLSAPARSPGSPAVAVAHEMLVFGHQTPVASSAVYTCRLGDLDHLEVLERPAVQLDDMVTRRLTFPAADGTTLAVQLTGLECRDPSQPRPLLLTAYGGFGVSDLPMFVGSFRPFIEAGGLVGWATIRGGGERGDGWRRGGCREHKTTHYDDFCDVAAGLIAAGITDRQRLVVFGASNGGLLAAAAAIRRPDLFAAVVAHLPFSDLIRFDRHDLARGWLVAEWGDPDDPGTAPHLLAASPYHSIGDGVAYPPTLVIAAENDDMAPSWHARKLARRLGDASTNDVLFRVWRGLGHLEAAAGAPTLTAEWLAFLMSHAGLTNERGGT